MTLAIDVRPGDLFPPGKITSLERQTISKVESLSGRVVFFTTAGDQWSFAPFEEVKFPRRNEVGTTYDHRESGVPLAEHVYPGDKLPSVDGVLDGDEEFGIDPPQTVRSVIAKLNGSIPVVYITTTTGAQAPPNTYAFMIGEPVVFPRPRTTLPNDRPTATGELIWFGPYENVKTGALFQFAQHPHGRGRWPSWVPVYDPELQPLPDGKTHQCRYPKFDWDVDLRPSDPNLPRGHVRGPSRQRRAKL